MIVLISVFAHYFISGYDQCARETTKVGDVKGISLGCVMKADCKRLEDNCNKWSSKARSCKVEWKVKTGF